MSAVVVVVTVGALCAWLYRRGGRRQRRRRQEYIKHLRDGTFPCACSECGAIDLACRYQVYERELRGYARRDARALLLATPAREVLALAHAMFRDPHAPWRRCCSERCGQSLPTRSPTSHASSP